MLKIILLLGICLALGYALDKKAEITKGEIRKVKNSYGVCVKSNEGKTEIKWKKYFSAYIHPLSATFVITFPSLNKTDTIKVDNLCKPHKKDSMEEVVRIFILKTIANIDTCPIKWGMKATFSVPYSFLYTVDDDKCGPFKAEMKVFKKWSLDKSQPLLLGTIEGNIIGCE